MFLYGIDYMSVSLKNLSGNKLKLLIEKATSNIFVGILTGLVVTLLIQSSSGTTVIVIGLISAGLMTLKQAIGVMMGANIGTTVTAFVIGLNVSEYSMLFVGLGSLLVLFVSAKRLKLTGGIVLGFGLLFIGLELMSVGLDPLTETVWFKSAMITLSETPVLGVLAGTLLTTIVQSSSGSIGVLQQIFADGNIALPGALAVLLGANIGTTITAILASLSSPREAKQASIFHLLFNIFGTIIFVIMFNPLISLFEYFESAFLGANNKLTIAFAHMLFNLATTFATLFLIKYFVKLIERILPVNRTSGATLAEKLNYDLIDSSTILALENTKGIVIEMGEIAFEMINLAREYQNKDDEDLFNKIATLETKIDYYDHSIHDYLMHMQSFEISKKDRDLQIVLFDTIRDFERIADHAVNLSDFYKNRYDLGSPLTGKLCEDLNVYFDLIVEQVRNSIISFKTNDKNLARKIIITEAEVDRLEKVYRRNQVICNSEDSNDCNDTHYVDILANLERISDHCNNIAENVIDPHYFSRERMEIVRK